jgi:acetyl-CoA carboxylase carboxyl transferase subunit beta
MNWIQKKLQSFVEKAKQTFKKNRPSKAEQANSAWVNCPGCNQMKLREDLKKNFNICDCNHHFDLDPKILFTELLFDEGEWEKIPCPPANPDPLNFKIGDTKYIDKYNANIKKTNQDSAVLAGIGEVNGLKIVAFGYNFSFGGNAMTPRENEQLMSGIQKALDEKVDGVISIYQSGGMSVATNIHGLSTMPKQMFAMRELRKAGIVTIGILEAKITGGTFCNTYSNDFLFSTNPANQSQLFAGKRVSASVNKGQALPENFGVSSSLQELGMIDGVFKSRIEIRERISSLIRVLLKKSEKEAKAESTSNVKVDIPASNAS